MHLCYYKYKNVKADGHSFDFSKHNKYYIVIIQQTGERQGLASSLSNTRVIIETCKTVPNTLASKAIYSFPTSHVYNVRKAVRRAVSVIIKECLHCGVLHSSIMMWSLLVINLSLRWSLGVVHVILTRICWYKGLTRKTIACKYLLLCLHHIGEHLSSFKQSNQPFLLCFMTITFVFYLTCKYSGNIFSICKDSVLFHCCPGIAFYLYYKDGYVSNGVFIELNALFVFANILNYRDRLDKRIKLNISNEACFIQETWTIENCWHWLRIQIVSVLFCHFVNYVHLIRTNLIWFNTFLSLPF